MSNLIIRKPDEFLVAEQALNKLVEYSKMDVVDMLSKKLASDNLGALKTAIKQIESRKLEITAPYRDAVSKFNSDVKDLLDPANDALNTLNKKFTAFVVEQERLAREQAESEKRAEIARLEAEAKLMEQAIIDTMESTGDDSLAEEAMNLQAMSAAKIEQLRAQDIMVQTKSAKGQQFTTGVQYLPRAKVVDVEAALKYIAMSGRFELVDFNQSALNALAKTMLKDDKSQRIKSNGIEYFYEFGTRTR